MRRLPSTRVRPGETVSFAPVSSAVRLKPRLTITPSTVCTTALIISGSVLMTLRIFDNMASLAGMT
jgi:hypothetical protein